MLLFYIITWDESKERWLLFAHDLIENYIRIKAQSYDLSNNFPPAPSAEGHRLYRLCEALLKVNFPY